MRGKRLWRTLNLFFRRSAAKRAEYLKYHNVFANIGESCSFMPRIVPLYPELISMGDNVRIASNVTFITHDCIHKNLNWYSAGQPDGKKRVFNEGLGCIEIGNNVFIGEGSHIFYDVRIGENVIVVSGSVVTNDIPSNTVVRGNPARKICSFDDFYKMKAAKESYAGEASISAETLSPDLVHNLWDSFHSRRIK